MNNFEFASCFLFLDSEPISFADRPYLPAIYQAVAQSPRTVVEAARQTEKSTTASILMLQMAATRKGHRIIYLQPRQEQLRWFSLYRLLPMMQSSPVLQSILCGRGYQQRVFSYQFSNGSTITLVSAFNRPDAARGLSADAVFLDEAQDLAADCLPVLEPCLLRSRRPRLIITGTAKLAEGPLETYFRQSTANEWTLSCEKCGTKFRIDKKVLQPQGLVCPQCARTVDVRLGRWVPGNPHADWAVGFRLSQPMLPELNYKFILDALNSYDPMKFENEILGRPVTLRSLRLLPEELEACCRKRKQAQNYSEIALGLVQFPIVAGIDWSGAVRSTTVVCVGVLDANYVFHVLNLTRFPPATDPDQLLLEIPKLLRALRVNHVAADVLGPGSHLNVQLFKKFNNPDSSLVNIAYTDGTTATFEAQTSNRYFLSLPKTMALSGLVARIRQQQITFPELDFCRPYFADFLNLRAEHDEKRDRLRYVREPGSIDDAAHAVCFAVSLAQQMAHKRALI